VSVDEDVRPGEATDSVTFAFGDPQADRYGLARLGRGSDGSGSALCILFAGHEPVAAHARGGEPVGGDGSWRDTQVAGLRATVDAPHARWTVTFDAEDGQGFALEFAALGEPVESDAGFGGMAGYEQPCQVTGTVRAGGRATAIAALGQRGRAWGDPDWERIELARSVGAWTDAACATLTAIRPAGASNHAEEAVWAAYWEPEGPLEIDDGRLSTTYDGDGRMRRAGLELWPADEESWARRAAGEVLCGSSLDLGSLRLDCAFFRWHLEGRTGVGRYDILRRAVAA
jgi:hypothetical protein